ncbi:uncharacterized protein GIQ15_04131 [Arthroderma uncinatum]|uniref:uncharacterized protein n=1 Tax=Arthroderma uncinatum TaxID=74035 RepID=UPI00144A5139|nr:uncharacterized protein GIQ15_04131 [Arthroderma uncinatum]KAF3481372.1 hypothetical protein GIQ15_04131 [Arthroderma uncinatum]
MAMSSTMFLEDDYQLFIRQQPERARVAGVKDKERKPIDPPPIIQLRVNPECEAGNNYLQSPYYFMCCSLYNATEDPEEMTPVEPSNSLTGTLVSSLHRLKDVTNQEGEFKLMFDLFELKGPNRDHVGHIKSLCSESFTVLPPKNFPGMAESTIISKSFADQGVKLRIRKEPRTLLYALGTLDSCQPRDNMLRAKNTVPRLFPRIVLPSGRPYPIQATPIKVSRFIQTPPSMLAMPGIRVTQAI